MRFLATLPLCALLLSGCATSLWEFRYGPNKPAISFVSLTADEKQPDKLYAWPPDSNAAYVFQSAGGTTAACIANADVARSRTIESSLAVRLGELLGQVDGNVSVEQKLKVIESLTKLSARDNESSSFLNVALFHICLEAGAGKLGSADVKELMKMAISSAATLGKPVRQTTAPARAPAAAGAAVAPGAAAGKERKPGA